MPLYNPEVDDRWEDSAAPNGFVDASDITISFSDSAPDRTFTIQPSGTEFTFYQVGVEYVKGAAETIQITDVEGLHVIYYDDGVLNIVVNPTHSQMDTIILTQVLTAIVYWNATDNEGKLFYELHGTGMSSATHHYLHDTVGASYISGLALGDFVISDGTDDEDAQFSVALGIFYDEDIDIDLSAVGKTTGLEVWYLDGGDWRWATNAGFSLLTAGGGRMAWNDAGAQAEVTDNRFALTHIFGMNEVGFEPIAIQGQAEYLNANDARDGAEDEINNLVLSGLPVPEMIPIASVIYQTKDTYGNTVKSKIVQTALGENYVDFRRSRLVPTITAQEHGDLAGLTDDDHTQYLLRELENEPSADLAGDGIFIKDTVDINAEGITAPLFKAADGNWETADATDVTTAPATGMALEAGTGADKEILMYGTVRNDAWNWTTGPGELGLIFLSITVGTLTQTRPSATDEVVQIVGHALSDDSMFWNPQLVYLEVV